MKRKGVRVVGRSWQNKLEVTRNVGGSKIKDVAVDGMEVVEEMSSSNGCDGTGREEFDSRSFPLSVEEAED